MGYVEKPAKLIEHHIQVMPFRDISILQMSILPKVITTMRRMMLVKCQNVGSIFEGFAPFYLMLA
jgi:hypothetical protein